MAVRAMELSPLDPLGRNIQQERSNGTDCLERFETGDVTRFQNFVYQRIP